MAQPKDLPNIRPVVEVNRDAFTVFQKQVAAAGTPEQLPDTLVPHGYKLVVKAESSNTGNIQVGHTEAVADEPTDAFILAAGEALVLAVNNASIIWIDATVSGDGVECAVEQ